MTTVKPFNNSQWTQARFNSFIKGILRAATYKWGPKQSIKKAARVSRGIYLCAGYDIPPHEVPLTLPPKEGKKRIPNIEVDHIIPVIDPKEGFVSWDKVILRMFCEENNLQILCKECHKRKSNNGNK